MNQAFISLGTNIEPRKKYLVQALNQLAEHNGIIIRKKSSIYETAPVGYVDQAQFLNMVVQIDTSLSPIDLLNDCQQIEKDLGRKRSIRFGPRTIDLDILIYNQEIIHSERLTIPHPRMHKRAFVLIPLQEIASNLFIPHVALTIDQLVKQIDPHDMEGVGIWEASK